MGSGPSGSHRVDAACLWPIEFNRSCDQSIAGPQRACRHLHQHSSGLHGRSVAGVSACQTVGALHGHHQARHAQGHYFQAIPSDREVPAFVADRNLPPNRLRKIAAVTWVCREVSCHEVLSLPGDGMRRVRCRQASPACGGANARFSLPFHHLFVRTSGLGRKGEIRQQAGMNRNRLIP